MWADHLLGRGGLESIKSWKFPTCSHACSMGRCVAESGAFWVGSAPHQLKISPSAIALRSQSHARIRPLLPPMVPSSVPTDNPPCPPPVPPYSKQFQAFLPTFSQSLTSFLARLALELRSILAALSRQHSTQDSCPFHYDETDSGFLFSFQPSRFFTFFNSPLTVLSSPNLGSFFSFYSCISCLSSCRPLGQTKKSRQARAYATVASHLPTSLPSPSTTVAQHGTA